MSADVISSLTQSNFLIKGMHKIKNRDLVCGTDPWLVDGRQLRRENTVYDERVQRD